VVPGGARTDQRNTEVNQLLCTLAPRPHAVVAESPKARPDLGLSVGVRQRDNHQPTSSCSNRSHGYVDIASECDAGPHVTLLLSFTKYWQHICGEAIGILCSQNAFLLNQITSTLKGTMYVLGHSKHYIVSVGIGLYLLPLTSYFTILFTTTSLCF
jgi:hypothetical protein